MHKHTNHRPQTLGMMSIGTFAYAPAAALIVDQCGTWHLRADEQTQARPDRRHELFIARTQRGFLVDITALDGVPERVASADVKRCAPVIEVVFGDEAILAA